MFIGMPLPEEISGGKNGLFMVLNPLYEARRKGNSDDGSRGNTNIAVDIESEA